MRQTHFALPIAIVVISVFAAAFAGAAEKPMPTLDELLTQAEAKKEWVKNPYTIKDGKVDLGVYRGWRQFHGVCHVCHGADANGSTFAPNLLDSFADKPALTYKKFIETVYNGIQAGKQGRQAMLAFGNNRDVMRNLDNLYAYLRARSEGVLGPGRPRK